MPLVFNILESFIFTQTLIIWLTICVEKGIHAQLTTMNIFPGDPNLYKDLRGEIIGVGAEGTTYVISGSLSTAPVTGMYSA